MFELASGAVFADVFLSGFGRDVKAFGDGEIGAAVEFGREAVEEGLTEDGDSASSGVGIGGWKLAVVVPSRCSLNKTWVFTSFFCFTLQN